MINSEYSVNVTAFPRVHMGLLDCGYATERLYGGLGVAVDGLFTQISASPADEWRVVFSKKIQASLRTSNDMASLVQRLERAMEPSCITVENMAPEHLGLGSKTTLLLGTTTAALAARRQPLNRETIIDLTKRGGASGIGVNLFWEGGMIADGGHKIRPADRIFAPSSSKKPYAIPPIISRLKMPSDWKIRLCYDPSFHKIEGEREVEMFRKVMPIADIQCLTAIALVYHGILPSVLEVDLKCFANVLRQMNAVGMKDVEVRCQTAATRQFLDIMWSEQIAAGLSSFGPSVFVVGEKDSPDMDIAHEVANEQGLINLGLFDFKNTGASISQNPDG